jgi:hypothetical protein
MRSGLVAGKFAEVIVVAEPDEGGKGFFSQAGASAATVLSLDTDALAEKVKDLASLFGKVFDRVSESVTLEKIELSIEVTAKGEIRLIAAGGVETKGAIKLILSRK